MTRARLSSRADERMSTRADEQPPCGAYVRVMGWIIAGIVVGTLLFAVYAVITLRMAALGAAMGAAQTPPARWSPLGLWLTLITVPAWGPIVWLINRLGRRVARTGEREPPDGRTRRW